MVRTRVEEERRVVVEETRSSSSEGPDERAKTPPPSPKDAVVSPPPGKGIHANVPIVSSTPSINYPRNMIDLLINFTTKVGFR